MPLKSLLLTALLLAPAAAALEATVTTEPDSPEARTGTLTVTDAGQTLWTATTPGLRWARVGPLSPDGRTLALLGAFGYVQLWDVPTGQRRATLLAADRKSDKVSLAAFSPDGRTLVTHAYPYDLSVWDVATGKRLAQLAGSQTRRVFLPGLQVDFIPNSGLFSVAGGEAPAMVFSTRTGELRAKLPAPMQLYPGLGTFPRGSVAADLTDDGERIAVLYANGEIRLHDVPGGQVTRSGFWKTPGTSGATVRLDPSGEAVTVARGRESFRIPLH
ncbi:hypothetical protein Dcar01_01768 [Deinococcus carri]|uniref:WD40 repeat domain-containing protein n=1 Tax=Deinococcus carri TaxID=1211323 RepID=A0ABP9W6Q1_9DEIO